MSINLNEENIRDFRQWCVRSEKLRSKTSLQYANRLRFFMRTCTNAPPLNDSKQLRNYINASQMPAHHKALLIAALRKFYAFSGSEELGACLRRPRRLASKGVSRYFDEQTLEALIDGTSDIRWQLVFRLLFETACRYSEFISITPAMINFKKREISISGKGGRPRIVKFSPKTATLLKAYITQHDIKEKPLFTFKNPQKMIYDMRKIAKQAGLKDLAAWLSAHKFRHSLSVHLRRHGAPIEFIASYLGHSNIAITYRHYSHIHTTETAAQWDKFFK